MVSYAGALITTHGQSSPPPPAETVQECWGPFQSCHEPSPLWNMQQRAVWCIFMMSSVLTLLESKALCKNGKTTEYLQPFDARADLRQHQSRDHTKRQDMRAAPHGWTVAPAYAGHKTQKTRWTSRLRLKGQRSRHDAPSSKPCDKSQRKHQWLRAAVMRQAEAFPDFLWRGRWKHCVFEFWSNDHKKGWDEFSDSSLTHAQYQRQTKWKWVSLRFLRKQFGINVSTQGQDRENPFSLNMQIHTLETKEVKIISCLLLVILEKPGKDS